MALKKCRECGKEVSSKAKTCPSCGIKSPGRKQIGTLSGLALIGFVVWVLIKISGGPSIADHPKPATPGAYSPQHEQVMARYRGSQEKTAKDAIWTAEDVFKVAVIPNGSPRDGYAQTVCETLYDYGFRGRKVRVQIIDVAKLKNQGKWEKIGEDQCQ